MKVEKYTVKWHHDQRDDLPPTYTECRIEAGGLYATAIAFCHPDDIFCRDTGRRISMARCMSLMNLPKPERAKIWEAYRNMKPGGRW